MFVNCPFCRGLVATDPVTDQPPERCPRCSAPLRDMPGAAAGASGTDAGSGVAAAMADAFGTGAGAGHGGEGGDGGGQAPAKEPAPRPTISIANLLQPGPVTVVPESPPPVAVTMAPAPAIAAAAPNRVPAPAPAPAPEDAGPGADPNASHAPIPAPIDAAPTDAASAVDIQGSAAGPVNAAVTPDVQLRTRRAIPSFARGRRTPAAATGTGRRWPLLAAIAALTVVLALQWLLADRARLAADRSWRPVVAAACGLLRCSLPHWREPAAFVLLERDVRPHPDADGALRITASFRNEAAWAQPWPDVVLTLSDVDNRPLGARAFRPGEYLGTAPAAALMEAGEGAVIRMDVLEPGPGAVGFSFDFR